MPKAEHRLATKHIARRIQQCLGKGAPLMLKPQKCWYAASEICSLYSPQGYAKAMNN